MLSTQQEELLIPSECAPAQLPEYATLVSPPVPIYSTSLLFSYLILSWPACLALRPFYSLSRICPPSSLVDQNLIERARQLSHNVDRVVAAALASSSGHAPSPSTDPASLTDPPSSPHPPAFAPLPLPTARPPPSLFPHLLTTNPLPPPAAPSAAPCGSNFVYGEVDVLSFLHLLSIATTGQTTKAPPTFCDLGCGEGRTLLAAAACGRFEKVLGIELLPGLAESAHSLAQILASLDSEEGVGYGKAASRIEVRQEDLFQCPAWRAASVVYMCATCFEAGQMAALASLAAEHLAPHSRVLLLDKPFPEPLCPGLRLLLRCQCLVSWGTAAAYVYQVDCD